jgi:hypothetical protein
MWLRELIPNAACACGRADARIIPANLKLLSIVRIGARMGQPLTGHRTVEGGSLRMVHDVLPVNWFIEIERANSTGRILLNRASFWARRFINQLRAPLLPQHAVETLSATSSGKAKPRCL